MRDRRWDGPAIWGQSSWKSGVAFYCHSQREDTGERKFWSGVGENSTVKILDKVSWKYN